MTWVPSHTIFSSEEGDKGIVVYAIQQALNDTGANLTTDSVFGGTTVEAVKRFQGKRRLVADGVFGPKSSKSMALALIPKVETSAPKGLIRGLVEGESGNHIGAVNWSVPGGVDCSYTQRRVYDAQLTDRTVVERAFDPLYQLGLFNHRLKDRFASFLPRVENRERAWRLAVLTHNYPYAAEQYAEGTWPSVYALNPQPWVKNIGARFPDGVAVETPHDWCRHYSLSAPEHNDPGTMTKYVKEW